MRQFPITASQVAVLYNLGVKYVPSNALNLTRTALCGIFSGNITTWDHPEITTANPLLLPADVAGVTIRVRDALPFSKLMITLLSGNLPCRFKRWCVRAAFRIDDTHIRSLLQ